MACALSKERLGSNESSAETCVRRGAFLLDLQWCLPRDVSWEVCAPCEKCCSKVLVDIWKEAHCFW